MKPEIEYSEPLPSGAVPLFPDYFFPWGALPYPQQHAELGVKFLQSQDKKLQEIAQRMRYFQESTIDHHKQPLPSFLQQEGKSSHEALSQANRAFFDALGHVPAADFQFTEYALGLIARRSHEATLVCAASGCKSGMGSFLFQDAGIINFGPQVLPLGDCSSFGLAGRAQKLQIEEQPHVFSLGYCCRLATPHARKTNINFLEDSGYSGLWMKAEIEGGLDGLTVKSQFEGSDPLNRLLVSFFGKGEACIVGGSIKLNPRSLDRYLGPPDKVAFMSKGSGVQVLAQEGIASMEIIPLAGDRNFWGADFLVGYTLQSTQVSFELKKIIYNKTC